MVLKTIFGDETCGKGDEIAHTNTYPNAEPSMYCCKQTKCGMKDVFRVQNWMSVKSPQAMFYRENEGGLTDRTSISHVEESHPPTP